MPRNHTMKAFQQSLTKHLYRMDEVLSSLRWSIITHNITDTAFWTLELFQSNMVQECTELLETLWLYHIGFSSWFSLRLILNIYETGNISQGDLLAITCAFSKRRKSDSTIFHLLLRGATWKYWKPNFPHAKEYQCVNDSVIDCLRRGKLQEAWLLGRALNEEENWAILDSFAKQLGRSEELQIIKQLRECRQESLAAGYVLVSISESIWQESQGSIENKIPIEVSNSIAEWNSEKSLPVQLKKRRALKPKPEALLYLTQRSEQSPYVSSESEIQGDLLESLKKSEYWSAILESYMTNGDWKLQRYKEIFFDTYFPEDIPDEWSIADREKSHGRGLGKTIEQSRARFIHYTLQHSRSLELWNSGFPKDIDCSMDWDSLYSVKPEYTFPMKPLKKIFEIYDA